MALAVLPDGRVLHSARTGEIRIYNPKTGLNTIAADMRDGGAGLYQHDEEGVQGVALDPKFSQNKWVYVYYSPKLNTPVDCRARPSTRATLRSTSRRPRTARASRSSRAHPALALQVRGQQAQLGQRAEGHRRSGRPRICCHVGGKIDFDGEGNLYLSTGDDTNPFESEGYSPIDERSNRNPAFDAQRTSANTNDLRGKILRIRVKNGGGYSVPSGNLFRPGTARTKPKIYAMGFRNPFRMAVDKKSNNVYVGDYSPDANAPDDTRGPQGIGRWMLVDRPGNYGWP